MNTSSCDNNEIFNIQNVVIIKVASHNQHVFVFGPPSGPGALNLMRVC
jgi:hypothetical protein